MTLQRASTPWQYNTPCRSIEVFGFFGSGGCAWRDDFCRDPLSCFSFLFCWGGICLGRDDDCLLKKRFGYDSRSKVLYSIFNFGGPQPTHLYDFSISLCGVTQGNHAKHKLGARFAQGWRKCFHACVDYPHILYIYIYHLLSCMYIDFIIKVFL